MQILDAGSDLLQLQQFAVSFQSIIDLTGDLSYRTRFPAQVPHQVDLLDCVVARMGGSRIVVVHRPLVST